MVIDSSRLSDSSVLYFQIYSLQDRIQIVAFVCVMFHRTANISGFSHLFAYEVAPKLYHLDENKFPGEIND